MFTVQVILKALLLCAICLWTGFSFFRLTLQLFLSWTFSWIFIKGNSLGRGVESQKWGPEWPPDWKMREKWQSLWESWELYQGQPQKVMKIGNIVRRDSLQGSHCSLALSSLKQTGESLSFPCSCLLSDLRNDAKASRGRAEFCGERLVRWEAEGGRSSLWRPWLVDPGCATKKTHSALKFYRNAALGWSFHCAMENQLLKQQHGLQNWLKTQGFGVSALRGQGVIL